MTNATTRYTYVATKTHPSLGPLIKIGSSANPDVRVRELAARLLYVMPYGWEGIAQRLLRQRRVWPKGQTDWTAPVYAGTSEWFLSSEPALALLHSLHAFACAA